VQGQVESLQEQAEFVQSQVHAPAAQEQLSEAWLISDVVQHVMGKHILGHAGA